MVAMAAPLLLAALGEILVERAGVINVGIEGAMLTGAFFAFLVGHHTGSPWAGAAAAGLAALVIGALLAVLVVRLAADQVVAGMALNLLALGVTGVLYRAAFGATGASLSTATLPLLPVPLLEYLPLLGKAVFAQNALGYLALALVPASAWLLFHTRLGLVLRACGENPEAAEAAGANVRATRFLAILAGCILAGLAGAYLSVGHANTFVEGMTRGRGFIALAVVTFGRWHPAGAAAAALLFGAADALQYQFQARGLPIPYQFFLALPYLATLAALSVRCRQAPAPAALGVPY